MLLLGGQPRRWREAPQILGGFTAQTEVQDGK